MRVVLSALFVVTLSIPASATVIEVPIPELVGTYSRSGQAATVHLPVLPSIIHGASLRLKGTTTSSLWSCDGLGGYGPPKPLAVGFETSFEAGTSRYWVCSGHFPAEGEFVLTQPFVGYSFFGNLPPTWDFLLDGVADYGLVCHGEPAIFECYQVGPNESTTLTEVTLLIDGEFPTPAATTSWGRVKSIYR